MEMIDSKVIQMLDFSMVENESSFVTMTTDLVVTVVDQVATMVD